MGRKRFEPEYKKEIIKLVTERGMKASEVARDIGISANSVRRWVKEYSDHGKDAFPGKGNLKPEDEEFRKLNEKLLTLRKNLMHQIKSGLVL